MLQIHLIDKTLSISKICERRDSDPGFSLGKAMSYQTRLHSHKESHAKVIFLLPANAY